MIKFELDKLTFKHYRVKSCTTANGGSLTVLDTEKTTDAHEVFKRIPCGMDIVRAFQVEQGSSKYYIPLLVAVACYDDRPVCIEKHPMGAAGEIETEGLWGMRRWKSNMEKSVEDFVKLCVEEGEWFIDGKYIYSFGQIVALAVAGGESLSSDGKFKALNVNAYQLSKMHLMEKRMIEERCCLAFVASNGQFAVTPPVWKDLSKLAGTQMNRADRALEDGKDKKDVMENKVEEEVKEYRFDKIDELLCVNLSFVLDAAKTVGENFGYDEIEYLQIDELMVRLHTVNLPKVSKAVKETFDTGLKFKTTLAWLIGKLYNATTLEQHQTMRGTIKYLTTKGIFFKASFEPTLMFKPGQDINSIPRIKVEDALEESKKQSIRTIINAIRNKNRQNTTPTDAELVNVAGLSAN